MIGHFVRHPTRKGGYFVSTAKKRLKTKINTTCSLTGT